MNSLKTWPALSIAACLTFVGCTNVLEEVSVKNSNDAYLFDAKTAINARDYDLALDKLGALTDEYQKRRDVIVTTAAAYAGRCGLDFLDVVRGIVDQPGARLFPLLLRNFKTATTGAIADCDLAQTWMLKLAPGYDFTGLSGGEGLFLAVVAIARIGATLGTYADLNHDGTADPTFDACNTTKFPDQQARALGVSLNLVLAGVAASGSSTITSSVAGVSSACASLPAGQNFCGKFDPTSFSATEVQVLNGLVQSQDSPGLGTCTNTFVNCICH